MSSSVLSFGSALLVALLCTSAASNAGRPSFESDIIVVDFNDRSASALGREWGRDYLAAVTEALFSAKARAVVIKMFLDTPGSEAIDARLERAMRGGRVVLQASINTEPPVSSELQTRFEYRGAATGIKAQLTGMAGWLPIARFQNAAAKVCFADAQVATIAPVVEEFGGKLYKSLVICVLEEASGGELVSVGPQLATIGSWQLPVTSGAGVPIGLTDSSFPERLAAEDVLLSKHPLSAVAGKVAIVSYSGSKSPTIVIAGNPVKVHQVFLAVLRDVFAAIRPVAP